MKREKIQVLAVPILVVILAASAVATESRDYLRGQRQAKQDVASGKYIVKLFGYPTKEAQERYKRAHEMFGVEIQTSCVISKKGRDFADGYNDISDAAIMRHFGMGFGSLLNADPQKIELLKKTKCPPGEYAKIGKLGIPLCCPDNAICD